MTSTLLVHKQWKYARGNMIEASWGGPHYPNGTTVSSGDWVDKYTTPCGMNTSGCLYDVVADMTEQNDVAKANPEIVAMMSDMMDELGTTIYSVSHANDPACTVAAETKFGGFYAPWLP